MLKGWTSHSFFGCPSFFVSSFFYISLLSPLRSGLTWQGSLGRLSIPLPGTVCALHFSAREDLIQPCLFPSRLGFELEEKLAHTLFVGAHTADGATFKTMRVVCSPPLSLVQIKMFKKVHEGVVRLREQLWFRSFPSRRWCGWPLCCLSVHHSELRLPTGPAGGALDIMHGRTLVLHGTHSGTSTDVFRGSPLGRYIYMRDPAKISFEIL